MLATVTWVYAHCEVCLNKVQQLSWCWNHKRYECTECIRQQHLKES